MVQPFAAAAVRRAPRRRPAASCWPPPRPTTWSSRSPTLLGLDDVVATRYGVSADGTYDGTLDGPFVWGRRASWPRSREWADEHGIDLAES